MFVCDDLLIKLVDMNLLLPMVCLQDINEILQELLAEILNVFPGILADQQHLPDMTLALDVASEPVFVSELPLAGLAVPSQSAQALGLDFVADRLSASGLSAWHIGGGCGPGRILERGEIWPGI